MYFKYLPSLIISFRHTRVHEHTHTHIHAHTEGLQEWTHLEVISGAVYPVWPEPRGPLGFGSGPALPERSPSPSEGARGDRGRSRNSGQLQSAEHVPWKVEMGRHGTNQPCECLGLSGCPCPAKDLARQGHSRRHVL